MNHLNRDLIACFGDSITVGRPGVSYLKWLKHKRKYLNFGLGGDTLLGLSKRMDDFLRGSSCHNFIIEIGCNDILLPYLRKRSNGWTKVVDQLMDRGSVPLLKVRDFAAQYEKLINKLANKQIMIISIPCIGENLESDLNQKVMEYNEAIKSLCQKYGLTYIDFNGWQCERIHNKKLNTHYFITDNPLHMIRDVMTTTYLGMSDWISQRRKLVVTVDGMHLNKEGAKGLAHLIEKKL